MMRQRRHDHRENDQHHAGDQQRRVPLGREHVALHRPDHQRQADAHRKCHRHARRVDAHHQQNIRDVEEDAAEDGGPDRAAWRAAQVLDKRHPRRARAAQRECEHQGEREHADRVVPIEKLKRPFILARQFLRIRPRPPTQHRDDAKQHGDAEIVNDKHASASIPVGVGEPPALENAIHFAWVLYTYSASGRASIRTVWRARQLEREDRSMSFIAWIILGLIAGFIGSKLVNRRGEGFVVDVVLGVVGAVVGGWLFNRFGATGVTGLNLYSLLVAVIGAVVVLVVYHAIRRAA